MSVPISIELLIPLVCFSHHKIMVHLLRESGLKAFVKLKNLSRERANLIVHFCLGCLLYAYVTYSNNPIELIKIK